MSIYRSRFNKGDKCYQYLPKLFEQPTYKNSDNSDQTAPEEQSDQDQHCLSTGQCAHFGHMDESIFEKVQGRIH